MCCSPKQFGAKLDARILEKCKSLPYPANLVLVSNSKSGPNQRRPHTHRRCKYPLWSAFLSEVGLSSPYSRVKLPHSRRNYRTLATLALAWPVMAAQSVNTTTRKQTLSLFRRCWSGWGEGRVVRRADHLAPTRPSG